VPMGYSSRPAGRNRRGWDRILARSFLLVLVLLLVFLALRNAARHSVTSATMSPDGRWEARITDARFHFIDRNFGVELTNLKTGDSHSVFGSYDEAPSHQGEERILWSPDSTQFVVIGRHLYTIKNRVLSTGEKLYLLYDVPTGEYWCNRDDSDDARFDKADVPWIDQAILDAQAQSDENFTPLKAE
jgi:hypothetical protein